VFVSFCVVYVYVCLLWMLLLVWLQTEEGGVEMSHLKTRIQTVIGILNNFKQLRDGTHSRSDYIELLKHDLQFYFGYTPYLIQKFLQIFTPSEVQIICCSNKLQQNCCPFQTLWLLSLFGDNNILCNSLDRKVPNNSNTGSLFQYYYAQHSNIWLIWETSQTMLLITHNHFESFHNNRYCVYCVVLCKLCVFSKEGSQCSISWNFMVFSPFHKMRTQLCRKKNYSTLHSLFAFFLFKS
jgi:hypothetical protein